MDFKKLSREYDKIWFKITKSLKNGIFYPLNSLSIVIHFNATLILHTILLIYLSLEFFHMIQKTIYWYLITSIICHRGYLICLIRDSLLIIQTNNVIHAAGFEWIYRFLHISYDIVILHWPLGCLKISLVISTIIIILFSLIRDII